MKGQEKGHVFESVNKYEVIVITLWCVLYVLFLFWLSIKQMSQFPNAVEN